MRGYLILTVMGLMVLSAQAQRVSNVIVTQEGQKLRIQYELSASSPAEVGLYISENNGGTWMKISQYLSGDVGPKVSGGSKEIVWDVLQARESLVGNSIVFKVKAGSEIKSVKIGNQVWMAENLNVDHYRNGDPIPTNLSDAQWKATTQGACAFYDDDLANKELYGNLYNWYAANDSRGLCPLGWHVPTVLEWDELIEHCGGKKRAALKLKHSESWGESNNSRSNNSYFNALPGGYRFYYGEYNSLGKSGYWWASNEMNETMAHNRKLYLGTSEVLQFEAKKQNGISVRCIKD